jgi:outer membrane protein
MNNSLAGKSVKIKLDKMNKSNTEKFKKIEVNLKTKESKIVSQKKILNENEYIKKVDSFKIEVNDFNLKKQKAINEINLIQNNSQKKLTAHLTTILTDYSKKNSIDYILTKQNIIIGRSELDITNIIIEILDSKIKKIKFK